MDGEVMGKTVFSTSLPVFPKTAQHNRLGRD